MSLFKRKSEEELKKENYNERCMYIPAGYSMGLNYIQPDDNIFCLQDNTFLKVYSIEKLGFADVIKFVRVLKAESSELEHRISIFRDGYSIFSYLSVYCSANDAYDAGIIFKAWEQKYLGLLNGTFGQMITIKVNEVVTAGSSFYLNLDNDKKYLQNEFYFSDLQKNDDLKDIFLPQEKLKKIDNNNLCKWVEYFSERNKGCVKKLFSMSERVGFYIDFQFFDESELKDIVEYLRKSYNYPSADCTDILRCSVAFDIFKATDKKKEDIEDELIRTERDMHDIFLPGDDTIRLGIESLGIVKSDSIMRNVSLKYLDDFLN